MELPDLSTEDSIVIWKLLDWVHKLVQDYGVDGSHIDTVKHIRKDFGHSKATGAFTLGEVLINDTDYDVQYTGEWPTACIQPWISTTFDLVSEVLDAILDYPSYFQMRNTFLDTQGEFSAVASTLISSQQKFKNSPFRTDSFVEGHDQPQLASVTKDPSVCHSYCSAVHRPERNNW